MARTPAATDARASSQQRAALSALLRAFAAESRPHSTAFGRQSCGTEGTRVAIPGPRSHCTPGLSCATDARVYTELGSRAKTGLGARRSPQKAVSHRRRTERRLAIAQRSRSASAHLCRRAHEQLQPGAAPGCNPPFVTLSLGLDPGGIARSTASACRCGSFDDDAAERRRIRPMPNLNARDAA